MSFLYSWKNCRRDLGTIVLSLSLSRYVSSSTTSPHLLATIVSKQTIYSRRRLAVLLFSRDLFHYGFTYILSKISSAPQNDTSFLKYTIVAVSYPSLHPIPSHPSVLLLFNAPSSTVSTANLFLSKQMIIE